MSRVVLDLPPIQLLWLTALLPLSLILWSRILLPSILFVLPAKIRRSRILLPPSDGSLSKDAHSDADAELTSRESAKGRRSTKDWLMSILAMVEAVAWGSGAVWGAIGGEGSWEEMVTKLFIGATWSYAALSPLYHPPTTAPYLLFFVYITFTLTSLLSFEQFLLHSPYPEDLKSTLVSLFGNFVICCTLLTIVVSFPISAPVTEEAPSIVEVKIGGKDTVAQPISPEGGVTLFAWISFSWVAPLIKQGSTAKLNYEDVWRLTSTMQSEGVRRSGLELSSTRMIPRIFFNNSLDLCLSLTLGLVSSTLSYLAPFFLKQILTSLEPPPTGMPVDPTLRQSAFIYAALAFFAQLLRAEVDLQQLWHERRAIVRCRSQLMGEVYEKALKRRDLSGVIANKDDDKVGIDGKPLDEKAKRKKEETASSGSTGKIVMLMSSDAQRVANQLMGLSSLVAAPFELVIAIVFLYQLLGWTCIAGLSVMAISLPLNQMLVTRRVKMHRAVLASRDKRMDVLNEFIQAIRFVKYSASEGQWLDRVFSARTFELSQLLRTRLNNLMIGVIWSFTPDVVIFIAFLLFTKVLGQELTVPVAFTSLALFALIRAPMSMLPMSITSLLQTYVSIERLEAFLKEPEVESWVSALRPDDEATCVSLAVSMTDATFRYQDTTTKTTPTAAAVDKKNVEAAPVVEVVEQSALVTAEEASEIAEEEQRFELRDINVDFPIGKLSLIVGPTGSGKSSMFLGLLGEMDRIAGSVNLPKGLTTAIDSETGLYNGVAFTAQLPWLEHASIKNNILFGSPFESDRYSAVLDACALRPDLKMFAAGDETEIGEKGISLSGGQKARVALARAVYSRAKTVLLDDPLSAIDMHTARHVFKECLKGPLMAHRTIILITHHVALCLSGAEYLVRMSSGRVEMQGPVDELDKSAVVSELLDDVEEEETVEEVLATSEDEVSSTENDAVIPAAASSGGKLVEEELRATGRVKWTVYKTYLAAAGWWVWAVIVFFVVAGRASRVLDRYVLKLWGESYRSSVGFTATQYIAIDPQQIYEAVNVTRGRGIELFYQLPSASDNVNPYLAMYAGVCLLNLALSVLTMLAGYQASFSAARILFTQTLKRVAFAPFRYYDTTPTGRILNRFSTDFQTIDTSLTDQVRTSMGYAASFIVNVVVIIIVSPMFIPPAILIIFAYVKLSLSYVKTSRDLRRLESSARSPIYSKFGETLSGIATCRAFGAERRFLSELFANVDAFLSAHYASAMVNRYLLWRFDFLGALAVAITTFLSLAAGASPGLAALSITSAQTLVQSVYWLCRYISALEVDLNAVERVTELLEIPQEPPMIVESKRPAANWPSDVGGIVIEDLVISYAPALPPVIKGISFEIAPRQKVGVVGRTGSGKSTFALSLLRFVDPTSGRILIDGIDITTIGLQDLRSRLTLIPQEAVLFTGTVRTNLDPFNQHTDSECMDALERVQMVNTFASTRPSAVPSRIGSPFPGTATPVPGASIDAGAGPILAASVLDLGMTKDTASEETRVDSGRLGVTLETKVSQGGHNFSAGQRQLLAMARALLRRSKIIIMDEATASVDFETDAKIQNTIREEFADSLVITIAHRLKTVIDYDQILVLENGTLIEFGSPAELLTKSPNGTSGAFRKMCEQSSDWEELKSGVQGV